jgi:DNA replication protein DnaC
MYLEKERRFGEVLEDFIERQIGLGYCDVHQNQFLSCWSDIREHIIHLYETGIGACYCGGTGSGKSHTLLEFIILLCWREWEEAVKDSTFPSPLEFIEKTVHFSYAVDLAEALSLKQKIPFAKYNLIDDLGAEVTTPYVQSRLDEYFETINRKGLNLVITSNISKDDIARSPMYQRIYSRMLAKVEFYELPCIDWRDPKNSRGEISA